MGAGQKGSRDGHRRWIDNNLEEARVLRRVNTNDWQKNNRDKINKRYRDDTRGMELLCEIREKHLEDMKDDPESMTPEFLNTIQNLGCKKKKK